MISEIYCKQCGEWKPPERFHRARGTRTGRQPICAVCAIENVKQWQRDNPDKHYAKQRRSNLKVLYGISESQYDELLDWQNGRCAICGEEPRGRGSRGRLIPLAVDHDHRTGAIRGLLCHHCNVTLGLLGDTFASVQRFAEYLGVPPAG